MVSTIHHIRFAKSFHRWISNKYMRTQPTVHTVDQTVEWLYCFDIHCNSFFPTYLLLYVLQFFFLPLFMKSNFVATFFANTIYLASFIFYYYITFLGYDGEFEKNLFSPTPLFFLKKNSFAIFEKTRVVFVSNFCSIYLLYSFVSV
jgi:hypothetical protein